MTSNTRHALSPALKAAIARLDQLVNWERKDRTDLTRTLDPVRGLLECLGAPQSRWKSVHVTGTKGKSSTTALIALGLQRAGHRTGFYTSPHVERITERVRIDGCDADDDDLAAALDRSLHIHAEIGSSATYFDVLTAAAFDYFAAQSAGWVAVECGLGGRLDSTNAIESEVAVLTNVDLEHTETLGKTRAAIAREKVGILKPKSVLVTGISSADAEVWPVLAEAADRLGSALVSVPLAGRSLLESNLALAQAALNELGKRGLCAVNGELLSESLIDSELAQSHALPGRMEFLSRSGRTVVLDGAHVASSIRRVLDETESSPVLNGKPICIVALRMDKDHLALLKTLLGRVDRVICTSLESAPFRAASELEVTAKGIGLNAMAIKSPGEALDRALELAGSEGWVLGIGSLYLAGALRHELGDA